MHFVLDPVNSKVDGLAFLGLSLARKSARGNESSQTHQTAFDLSEVIDRDYEYLSSTNDDGWLVGGGEAGPPTSYKLSAPDSAHVEIMRIGTYKKELGGVPMEEIISTLKSCKILIPEITVVPTAVVANTDLPPELEIRFDMAAAYHDPEPNSGLPALPVNWQLRFIHNQLFRHFHHASRFCPGAFHSTIVRKAEFRSPQHRAEYFRKGKDIVKKWRTLGPQPLVPVDMAKNIERISTPKTVVKAGTLGSSPEYQSGLWLFTDRKTPTHYFEPNFLPPYDTPEKRAIIYEVLREEWCETSVQWVEASPLPKPDLLPVATKAEVVVQAPTYGCGVLDNYSDMMCAVLDPTYKSQ